MRCHPLLKDWSIPQTHQLHPYRLEVLHPDCTDEDYAAVIESKDRLKGMMGGTWLDGLTLDNNRIDLCWHLREFENSRSFAWIVRDSDDGYLGCAYVFPDFGTDSAQVSVWIRSASRPEEHEQAFSMLLMHWLQGQDWPAFQYRLNLPDNPVAS